MSALARDNSFKVAVTTPGDIRFGVPFEAFLENDGMYAFWGVMSRDDDLAVENSDPETDDDVGVELTHANLASAADLVSAKYRTD